MAQSAQLELDVSIWRSGDPGGARGGFVRYRVPPALAYRFACRVGMCGSCAMTVNGRPRWTCRSHVGKVAPSGRLEIAPLANLPVIRDLATDMTGFFEKWQRVGGRFAPSASRADPPARVDPESPARQTADAGIECINCGVCYGACDVVRAWPDYLGPAALNRAWTLINDERHGDVPGVLRAAAQDGGCHGCHTQGSCTTHCPVGLDPSAAIAGLKRRTLLNWFSGEGRR
ncbi:MAG: succinate dehydrogenase/fumarate reductase iron-sulfur subunit [Alphaproteobacteria bacterium]